MTPEYRKIVIEFAYYDKNIDRTVYSAKLIDKDDKIVYSGHVYEKDIGSTVNDFLKRDMKY